MGWLHTLFANIQMFMASPRVVAAEKTISALMPAALSIVKDINTLAPNRTLNEINAIATKYAVPAIKAIAADPAATGNVLLNLGTAILKKNHAPDVATHLLQTAIQLAVAVTAPPTPAVA